MKAGHHVEKIIFGGRKIRDSPSITYTMEPTSPSRMIIEPAEKVTGYMQSTISRICVNSRFFMKSLSKMAALISSRDLERKEEKEFYSVLFSNDRQVTGRKCLNV